MDPSEESQLLLSQLYHASFVYFWKISSYFRIGQDSLAGYFINPALMEQTLYQPTEFSEDTSSDHILATGPTVTKYHYILFHNLFNKSSLCR